MRRAHQSEIMADMTKQEMYDRIDALEAALRPFAHAGHFSRKADAHYKIVRAPDESVGIIVNARDIIAAIGAMGGT